MTLVKYESSWIGIDSGREGLWKEPLWKDVLRIIASHTGENVYDESSPIYLSLERAYPKELWRSHTKEGDFRPLFRDYPNSWTRTGVVSLANQKFQLTELGKKVLAGEVPKADLLIDMFKKHSERTGVGGDAEKPFSIIASGILASPRALSTKEIYWSIMKNYRPGDDLPEFVKKKLKLVRQEPEPTPYRRLRNMLALMRAAEAIASTRKGSSTIWNTLNVAHLNNIK
jgi:hypothetical protein